jgi:hypothetical protein
MDFKAIATALASTIGTVTVGSTTLTATARLPDNVGQWSLLVFPPETDLSFLMGGPTLNAHLQFPVRLLHDPPAGVPDRTDLLYDWATALWPKPQSNYNLDVAGVIEAQAQTIRIAIDGHQYSFIDGTFARFDVVEMMVDVYVYELATFTP